MSFNERSFASRLGQMGDAAEEVFSRIYPRNSRCGLNRPDMNVAAMTTLSRCIPDFQTEDALVEVMGIGRDATLKLKVEKGLSLVRWTFVDKVDIFVSDSHRRRWWRAPLQEWLDACFEHGEIRRFPDNNKTYWALNAENFPTQPTATPRA